MGDAGQGIVHVIGPEQGRTLPGMTIVCGDSHTSTHGAFGALAFGIGTSEVEHVLATQTLPQARPRWMAVERRRSTAGWRRAEGRRAGDHRDDRHRWRARPRHRVPRRGVPVDVDGGADDGLQHVDRGRCQGRARRARRHDVRLPRGPRRTPRRERRGNGRSTTGARWSPTTAPCGTARSRLDASDACGPYVTWGTNPGQVATIDGAVPSPDDYADATAREGVARALDYMGISAGQAIRDIAVDTVFIGSCTNSRIEDLRAAAAVLDGRHVTAKRVLVVPGSHAVKAQAEAEGLDRIFTAAGADWRQPGCSMCLAMNPDKLAPGERSASTSNRNFEGRQGRGGRTHLVSPAVAAATAVAGHFATPEDLAMKAVRVITGTALPLRRADVDTDQIIPAEWLKRIERTGYEKGLFATLARRPRLRAQRRALQRRQHPRRRSGVRRRFVTRARRVGAPAVRLRRRDRPELLGHLPQQLHEERARARRRARERRRAALGRDRGRPGNDDRRRRRAARRRGAGHRPRRSRSRSTRRPSTASSTASTTSASRSATRPTITDYEADRPAWLT